MACGRPKNLEIAGRNLLCGPGDRRRNFLTTRDGNRRRGNPEPPGKGQSRGFRARGKSGATGKEGTPGHPAKDSPGLSGQGRSGATGQEETPGHRCGGNPVPSGTGPTSGPLASGKRGATRQEGNPQGGTSGHPAQGKLRGTWRRGNPQSGNEKKALGHGEGKTSDCAVEGKPRAA